MIKKEREQVRIYIYIYTSRERESGGGERKREWYAKKYKNEGKKELKKGAYAQW